MLFWCVRSRSWRSRALTDRRRPASRSVSRVTLSVRCHPGPGRTVLLIEKLIHTSGRVLVQQIRSTIQDTHWVLLTRTPLYSCGLIIFHSIAGYTLQFQVTAAKVHELGSRSKFTLTECSVGTWPRLNPSILKRCMNLGFRWLYEVYCAIPLENNQSLSDFVILEIFSKQD